MKYNEPSSIQLLRGISWVTLIGRNSLFILGNQIKPALNEPGNELIHKWSFGYKLTNTDLLYRRLYFLNQNCICIKMRKKNYIILNHAYYHWILRYGFVFNINNCVLFLIVRLIRLEMEKLTFLLNSSLIIFSKYFNSSIGYVN
jgi:hypothetical protein